jgi:hypothetical protein
MEDMLGLCRAGLSKAAPEKFHVLAKTGLLQPTEKIS